MLPVVAFAAQAQARSSMARGLTAAFMPSGNMPLPLRASGRAMSRTGRVPLLRVSRPAAPRAWKMTTTVPGADAQQASVEALSYPFLEVQTKWQAYWEENQTFRTPDLDKVDTSKPKFYALDMFPYPSGAGLHVGHPEGYTATDIMVRYKRMNGYNVMHPMGWDAFGLPAEQYAIQTGTHPKDTTKKNVDRFREQLKNIGFSYDWQREISTTDEKYYKWTQWIFLQLYEKGLAYQAEAFPRL
ncbi:hypothetical protein T484DRAFT_1759802 [Baffinella frigidus]|nr:hypothetical protein T484DRAFT_1759802 [Cryptophyta sp. CCMP2293]